jgi:hypothetical protein
MLLTAAALFLSVLPAQEPETATLTAGALRMTLERAADGIRLKSLFDTGKNREFLAVKPLPLFALTLKDAKAAADTGWDRTAIGKVERGLELRWERPGLKILAKVAADDAFRWTLRIENENLELQRAVFPQLALAPPGGDAAVFIPRGPGEVQKGIWGRAFKYKGLYPEGWAVPMQFLASTGESGLYFAMHDPAGTAKDIKVESRPKDEAVDFSFDHPAPDWGVAGNDLSVGEAVWKLLRGDWFDAAMVYREWARREARWLQYRRETPAWMNELCVWVQGGNSPQIAEFAREMGLPVGFHWYNWHQIPFDNDYPHYFPPKEGMAAAVRELQKSGVRVMPYINGRLWDTRDKGTEDFEFTNTALPAATKDQNGKPYVESYGSREADGSPVKLSVMCPKTRLWQEKVGGIVQRLFEEVGVDGVYIDQIGAAAPKLCYDRSHGHPLAGGAWWVESYGEMLEAIRRRMPPGRMITTECNAETFADRFDGLLTWHWQLEGQVPAFPAIYGGRVPMFGRAYGGGATKDLALRMKAGQQLAWGEQIGWMGANVVREKDSFDFLKKAVHLRHRYRHCFVEGEMARPPRLAVPQVKADWQWHGVHWVTADAVQAGAWRLPKEGKLVLLFANVGDEAVKTEVRIDGKSYGLEGAELRVTVAPGDETFTVPLVFTREISFPAKSVLGWEIKTK